MREATETAPSGRKDGAGMVGASLAAIASVLAASSCCLPILPMLFAAGFAGSSAFLEGAQPYLLAASVLSIVYGFYRAWHAKKCRRRTSRIAAVLLWVSAVFVFISVFFPQLLANFAADLLAW